MIGYDVCAQFNDSYAFRRRPTIDENAPWYELHQTMVPNTSGIPLPEHRRCAACGELLAKWDEPLAGLKIKKRRYDISATYDGVLVVSPRFREVYQAGKLNGLRFIPLPDDPGFFQIQSTEVAKFDAERSLIRFEKQCLTCGHYESVVGPRTILVEGETIPDLGFVRTDLEFASKDEKHPLLLCGRAAGQVLMAAKLKGLDLVKI